MQLNAMPMNTLCKCVTLKTNSLCTIHTTHIVLYPQNPHMNTICIYALLQMRHKIYIITNENHHDHTPGVHIVAHFRDAQMRFQGSNDAGLVCSTQPNDDVSGARVQLTLTRIQ